MLHVSVLIFTPVRFYNLNLNYSFLLIAHTDEGSYNDSNVIWKTPLLLPPFGYGISRLNSQQLRMGFNGQLLEPQIVNETETMAQISIPYNDEAGYRKVGRLLKSSQELSGHFV